MFSRIISACDIYLLMGVIINALLVNFTDKKLLKELDDKKAMKFKIVSIAIVVVVFILFIIKLLFF